MGQRFLAKRLRDMTDVEAAWLAGLLEGEGSFVSLVRRGVPRIRVSMVSVDRDVIDRVIEVTGIPTRTESKRPERQRCYHWTCDRRYDAVALIEWLYPFMGERRQSQMRSALDAAVAVWEAA